LRKDAALLLILILAGSLSAVARLGHPGMDRMLGTDEADYVRALSLGLASNYFGLSERSGYTFVRQVFDEYRATGWARPFQRDWEAGDAAGLRHYHPPLSLYPLGFVNGPQTAGERALRTVPVVTSVLAVLATVWLAFVLLHGVSRSVQLLLSATAGTLVALSPYHIGASMEIGAHAAFSLLSTLVLVALSLAVRQREPRWWIAGCAAMGLAMLTVPYWALLVPPVLLVWWAVVRGEPRSRRTLGLGALAALVALLIGWPPFVVEAAFVKPALMYAGIILRPLSSSQTPGAWVIALSRSHVVLAVLTIGGLALAPMLPRDRWRALGPAALFVAGFFVLNLRVGHMKELYASDVIAASAALGVALFGLGLRKIHPRIAFVAAVLALTAALVSGRGAFTSPAGDSRWRAVLAGLDEEFAGERVLVTPRAAGAIVKYYAPRAEIVLDSDHPDDVKALRAAMGAHDIDVVFRWGSGWEPGGVAERVTARLDPAGSANVSGTVVSWWRP
jgi:hypothetical protein